MKSLAGQQPPMTEEERREVQEWQAQQWQRSAIDTLFALAGRDPKARRYLAEQIAQFIASNEPFARALRKQGLKVGVKGDARGAHPVLSTADDIVLLTHYYLARFHGDSPGEAQRQLAESMGRSVGTIKNRLSDARTGRNGRVAISLNALPDFLRDIASADWPSR